MDVDAIVGSISPDLKAEGSLNQAIIAAAGEQIDDFILEHIFRPKAGDVFAVPPFNLPIPHIIYAVTPEWKDGIGNEDRDLTRCYRGIIHLAYLMKLKRIAIPAIGAGIGRYPIRRAARIGVQGIIDRMTDDIEEVRIVCNSRENYKAFFQTLIRYGWTPPTRTKSK